MHLFKNLLLLLISNSLNHIAYATPGGCELAIANAPTICAIGGQSLAAGLGGGAVVGGAAMAVGISGGAAILSGAAGAGAMANLAAAQACKAAMASCQTECKLEQNPAGAAQCTAVFTPLIATLTTQATAMGIAAGAGVGIGLLTKSSDSGGGSSAAETASVGGSPAINGTAGTIEGQTTQGPAVSNDAVCSSSGNCNTQYQNNTQDPVAALGTCAESASANLANCYDRLNEYCGGIATSALATNSICQNFCTVKANADSCNRVAQNTNPSGLPDPILPTQTNMNSLNSSNNNNTATVASVSSQHRGTCADPNQMHRPSCFNAMKNYCGQYKNGAGCSTFCSFYPNINECRVN